MPITWDRSYAQRVQRMQGSTIRELFRAARPPDMISFAGGAPAHELFPGEQIAAMTQRILTSNSQQALQYGGTEGYLPLREFLAARLNQEGVAVSPEHLLIISGSQQGLDLLGKVFCDPGDHLLVESPTYMGALQAFAPYEVEYTALPCDDEGLAVERWETSLHPRAKFLYVQPTFQNPAGITLSLERRQTLLERAEAAGLPIIEDDPYSHLYFEEEPPPSLLALEHRRQRQSAQAAELYQGNVIQVNTFSKVLAPGLRVGWIVGPTPVIRKLVLAKQGADLHTSMLNQMIAYELLQAGFLEEHLPRLRALYRQRRDAMLAALETYFPASAHWTHPQGGLFLWVTLPEHVDSTALLKEMPTSRVTFIPGTAFHPNGGGTNTMRLSFSNVTPERIEEGIKRLGALLQNQLE